ncbi:MAG: hypothetical protein LW850_10520 [Planctomycetaceae bacterium]|nr:hypothetical protein [Planctomycetaceae bacterium]
MEIGNPGSSPTGDRKKPVYLLACIFACSIDPQWVLGQIASSLQAERNPELTKTSEALIEIAQKMVRDLRGLKFSEPVHTVYDPLEYAWLAHEQYLERFASGPKRASPQRSIPKDPLRGLRATVRRSRASGCGVYFRSVLELPKRFLLNILWQTTVPSFLWIREQGI